MSSLALQWLFVLSMRKWGTTPGKVTADIAPSEDSDQPAHSRSLIRIFTGRILDSHWCWVSSCGHRNYDQTSQMRWLIWVFVGRTCQKVRFLTLGHKWSFWKVKAQISLRICAVCSRPSLLAYSIIELCSLIRSQTLEILFTICHRRQSEICGVWSGI